MKIEFTHVDFGAPFLFLGKNFNGKVDAKKDAVELWYDTDQSFMFMKYKEHVKVFDKFFCGDIAQKKAQPKKAIE